MFYIFCIFLALLHTSNFVRTDSVESRETNEHLTIDLNALKNAAEVVRVLKALNEDDVEPQSPHREEGYGKQEDGLQGIDIDYLGVNEARNLDIRNILELIKKNREAQENHDLTKPELSSRVYYISNPQVLEKYRTKVRKENERDSSASSDPEKRIKDLWELINTMRREGDADEKKHVPSFGANTGEDDKDVKKEPNLEYLKIIKEDKNNKYSKLTSALVNTGTTKMSSSSQEVGKKFKGKNALRTTKYESHERNYIKSNAKKVSWENTSEDDDTRYAITKIDFKAKDGSKEEEFEDKSLESYKPRKKGKKQKKESKFDDNNDDFTTTKKETSRTTPKRKETTSAIDDNYSGYSNKKKRNRWEKEERSEERIKFKPPRREPRKEERIYEMNKPRIKTQLNRPLRNQVSKIRNNNMGNNNYKAYGRTPIPIVGKKVVYEDD
ncbi:uncharacterized protein isoform X2 [Choristoneura fumiferana]|uniref:uncharacterized protein isoform X2 n=1 Tax=Choristoneura fumiferana TaxID=7141 RepID=UPI003D15C941